MSARYTSPPWGRIGTASKWSRPTPCNHRATYVTPLGSVISAETVIDSPTYPSLARTCPTVGGEASKTGCIRGYRSWAAVDRIGRIPETVRTLAEILGRPAALIHSGIVGPMVSPAWICGMPRIHAGLRVICLKFVREEVVVVHLETNGGL